MAELVEPPVPLTTKIDLEGDYCKEVHVKGGVLGTDKFATWVDAAVKWISENPRKVGVPDPTEDDWECVKGVMASKILFRVSIQPKENPRFDTPYSQTVVRRRGKKFFSVVDIFTHPDDEQELYESRVVHESTHAFRWALAAAYANRRGRSWADVVDAWKGKIKQTEKSYMAKEHLPFDELDDLAKQKRIKSEEPIPELFISGISDEVVSNDAKCPEGLNREMIWPCTPRTSELPLSDREALLWRVKDELWVHSGFLCEHGLFGRVAIVVRGGAEVLDAEGDLVGYTTADQMCFFSEEREDGTIVVQFAIDENMNGARLIDMVDVATRGKQGGVGGSCKRGVF